MQPSLYEQLARDRERAHQAVLKAEQQRCDLARLRHEHAGLRLDLAALKLRRGFARKYREDQLRVPAGNGRESGQFADEDGSSINNTDWTRVAQLDPRKGYTVNLTEEDARGGHTVERHVSKTDEYMLTEARRERPFGFGASIGTYRHGSFASLEDANDLTSRTLEQNGKIVDEVAKGIRDEEFVKTRFGYKTGREAIRLPQSGSQPHMRDTYGVGVLIRHDRTSPKGFRVHTAYPRND